MTVQHPKEDAVSVLREVVELVHLEVRGFLVLGGVPPGLYAEPRGEHREEQVCGGSAAHIVPPAHLRIDLDPLLLRELVRGCERHVRQAAHLDVPGPC